MPLYEYICPGTCVVEESGTEDNVEAGQPHVFEKIVPLASYQEKQECPIHKAMCERKEISVSNWQWGNNVVAWDAGLGNNPHGVSKYNKK